MFSIEYGPKGNQIALSGFNLYQVIPAAEALTERVAVDLRIIDRGGKSHDLPEFRLGLRLIVSS